MSESEIICLSSEDDDTDQAKKVNTKVSNTEKYNGKNTQHNPRKRIIPAIVRRSLLKSRNNSNTPKKRKIEETESEEPIEVIGVITKIKPTLIESSSLLMDCDVEEVDVTETNDQKNISSEIKSEEKPLLVVKEKHPVHATNGRHDIFSMFLSQCLLRDKSSDMSKIVDKLKGKYEQLDPIYAHSKEFEDLLNEKRDCLMNENGQVYKHISDIRDEMKSRQLGKNNKSIGLNKNKKYQSENHKEKNEKEEAEDEEEDREFFRKRHAKIKAIEKTMKVVEKRIKKYEEAEVDLDDESGSNFLMTERYKKRMVELYEKWCDLTGNHTDIGRGYLRPIHLTLTGIVAVDQTINSFINSKLDKKENQQSKLCNTNNLVFPDYVDILNLIHTHNEKQNLGMDTRAEKATAKQAFIKLGEYLKSERQKDLYDTFAPMYELGEDPAKKHDELKTKLRENREIGEKKLNDIFVEYSKKQEEWKSKGSENNVNSDDNDDDDDDDDEEEEEEHDEDLEENLEEEEEEEEDDVDEENEKEKEKEKENEKEEEKNEQEEVVEGDTEKQKDECSSIDLLEFNTLIYKSKGPTDDEAMIIEQSDGKNTSVSDLNEKLVKSKITELKVSEQKEDKDNPMPLLDDNLSKIQSDDPPKVLSSDEQKLDEKKTNSSSPTSTVTGKIIPSSVQAITFEVNVEPHDVHETSTILQAKNSITIRNNHNHDHDYDIEDTTAELIDDEDSDDLKPLLKLRSFAKPPGSWQSSQESKNILAVGKLKSVEIIDLDVNNDVKINNLNKNIPHGKILNNVIIKNPLTNQTTKTPVKLKAVPITALNKSVKIFRKLITIPSPKVTAISKSNIDLSKISIVNKNGVLRPFTATVSKTNSFVPLSAIDIRNQKSRTVMCTVGQKKSPTVPTAITPEVNITATHSKGPQTLHINPIAKNIALLTKKNINLPISSNKSSPVIASNIKSKNLLDISQKVINPVVKQQQQNIENIGKIVKIPEHSKNLTDSVNSSKFVSR